VGFICGEVSVAVLLRPLVAPRSAAAAPFVLVHASLVLKPALRPATTTAAKDSATCEGKDSEFNVDKYWFMEF